jgi:hypothetical protein
LTCEFVKTIELGTRYEPIILKIKEVYIHDDAIDEKAHIYLENIGRVGMEFLVDCKRIKNIDKKD